jgi:hypothetical protein
MRFKPRLIPPEPAPTTLSGDLDLPDDLRELAAQLHDDAQLLAERFPASEASFPALPRQRGLGGRTRILTAGVAIVAVIALGIVTLMPGNATNLVRHSQKAPSSTRLDLPTIAIPAHHRQEALVSLDEPAAVPLQVLSGVTGPEREGLLDLLEVDADGGTGISF